MILWLGLALAGVLAFAVVPVVIGRIAERLLRPLFRPPRSDRDRR